MTAPAAEGTARRSDVMHVVAAVGAERFAFRVADVESVLDAPGVVRAPLAPDGLVGQLEHRGATIRAYDAAWALGLADGVPPRGRGTALVLRTGDERVAILVDDVEELASFEATHVRGVPTGTDALGLLSGVVISHGDALVGVVNVAGVVARAAAPSGRGA